MLILPVKIGQTVSLTLPDGREVRVEVLRPNRPGRAFLGITADRDIPIWREDAKRKEPKHEQE